MWKSLNSFAAGRGTDAPDFASPIAAAESLGYSETQGEGKKTPRNVRPMHAWIVLSLPKVTL